MSFECQTVGVADGLHENIPYTVSKIFTKKGGHIYRGKKICELSGINAEKKCILSIKAKCGGIVSKLFLKCGEDITIGQPLIEVETCIHPTHFGNICADCGIVLDDADVESNTSKNNGLVSMLHTIPDLKVSKAEAKRLGILDRNNLLDNRKLVLLVDLDQTLIHTTNDTIPANLKDVFHFKLVHDGPWYHTRLRPFTHKFLQNISRYYELHICTFGVREYAHCIAGFLDPDRKLFGDRILSRNECLDPMSKTANLSSLFPCGDNLVCIIDDRSDVWNFWPNVVQVLPYHFFQHTGDINAPPGLQKKENDEDKGYDFNKFKIKKPDDDKEKQNSLCESSEGEDKEESNSSDINDDELKRSEYNIEEKCDRSDDSSSSSLKRKRRSSTDEEELEEPKDKKLHEEGEKNTSQPNEDNNKITNDNDKSRGENETIISESEEDSNKTNVKDICADEEVISDNTRQDSLLDDSSSTKEEEEKDSKEVESYEKKEDSDELDVDDCDDYLLYLEDILVKLHSNFYRILDERNGDRNNLPDTKVLVVEEKNKVLANCNLVFSGVIPQHTELRHSKAYHIALSLGANVTEKIVLRDKKQNNCTATTHLIAANLHTEKVHTARKMKYCKIVTPNWLWCCAERWEKVAEELFLLTEETEKTISRAPPMHCIVSPRPEVKRSEPSTSTVERGTTQSHELLDSNTPMSFFMSAIETKSMEQDVAAELSDDDEGNCSSIGTDDSESDEDDSHKTEDSGSDDEGRPRKKRLRSLGEDDEDLEDEEEELPSIRFRQGEVLTSDDETDDEDMNAFGDILAKQLME